MKKRKRSPSPESAFSPSMTSSRSPTKPTPQFQKKAPAVTEPTAAEASLVPAHPQGPHGGLDPNAPQIRWEDQERAVWRHGKLYFSCKRYTKGPKLQLHPWNEFTINRRTGNIYALCEKCRVDMKDGHREGATWTLP